MIGAYVYKRGVLSFSASLVTINNQHGSYSYFCSRKKEEPVQRCPRCIPILQKQEEEWEYLLGTTCDFPGGMIFFVVGPPAPPTTDVPSSLLDLKHG